MERKMTLLKHLLMVALFMLGTQLYAQKDDVVTQSGKAQSAVVNDHMKAKSAGLEMEKAFQSALENTNVSDGAVPAKSKSEIIAEKMLRKQELIDIIANNPANHLSKVGYALVPSESATSLNNPFPSGNSSTGPASQPTDDVYDLLMKIDFSSPAHTAIGTNGENIFVGSFNTAYSSGYWFSKFDMAGNFIEYFHVTGWEPGTTTYGAIDMEFDGANFWITNYTNVIKVCDLVNKVLVNNVTTTISGALHIALDVTNGIGYAGTWATFYSFNMNTGATITNLTSTLGDLSDGDHMGTAYDEISDGGPFVWFWTQGPGTNWLARLYKYNVTTSTMATTYWDAQTNYPGNLVLGSSSAGGLSSTALYQSGLFCLLGIMQGDGTAAAPNSMFAMEIATTIAYPNDVGVKAIVAPITAPGMGFSEPVTVTVKNYGSTPVLGGWNIKYKLDNNPEVTETFPSTLQPGDQIDYTFSASVDVHLYSCYSLEAKTALTGDGNINNDKKAKIFCNSVPFTTDTLWPGNAPYWTGTTDGVSFTETSLIYGRSEYGPRGWAKFDMSGIPPGAVITYAKLHNYLTGTSGVDWYYPWWDYTHVTIDPMTSTPADLWNNIANGTIYFTNTANNLPPLWETMDFYETGLADLNAALSQNWFAIGYNEFDVGYSEYYYMTFEGWAEAHRPYIEIIYSLPLQHDVSLESLNVPAYILASSPFAPEALVKNLGTGPETFDVTITGPNGYTDMQTVQNLPPLATYTVTFASQLFPTGSASFTACVSLSTDWNTYNNCKTSVCQVDPYWTKAYGWVQSPSPWIGTNKFVVEHPTESFTHIGPNGLSGSNFMNAGAWANGVWYAAEYFAPGSGYPHGHLYSLDTVTGAHNDIGPLGWQIRGMCYDNFTQTMYGIGPVPGPNSTYITQLYTIDLNSGVATMVHDFGTAMGLLINATFSNAGMIYTSDIVTDRTFAIDPVTYYFELVGPANIDMNYAQDAEFDLAHNRNLLAGYNIGSPYGGGTYDMDLSNGKMNFIGAFPSALELMGFAIPYTFQQPITDIGVEWIQYPKSGNTTGYEPAVVKLRNYGLTPADNFNICIKVDNIQMCENWSSLYPTPLAAQDTAVWYFAQSFNLLAAGEHKVKAWTSGLAGDENWGNDTAYKTISNFACGQITCYPNAQAEAEICGEDVNGGCYSVPEAFVDIQNGESWCGTGWKVDTVRDLDWYRFSITGYKSISLKLKSEFTTVVQLVKLPCTLDSVIVTKVFNKCSEDSLVLSIIGSGTYAFIVGHDFADYNTVCNGNNKYTFKFKLGVPKYCNAYHTSSCNDERITNITFLTTNNSTGCGLSNGYSDYTSIIQDVTPGQSVPFTVQSQGNSYWTSDIAVAWVDWNNDYDFLDQGEKFGTTLTDYLTSSPYTMWRDGAFTVPANAIPGQHRIRFRLAYAITFANMHPCTQYSYGECEDYTLNVVVPVPPIITTAPTMSGACSGTKIVPITVQNFNDVNGINLTLNCTGLTLLGYQNVNPALAGGSPNISSTGDAILMDWFSTTAATIGDGVLVELVVAAPAATIPLEWLTTGITACKYTRIVGGVAQNSQFVNGSMTYGDCSGLSGIVKYAKKLANGTPSPIPMFPPNVIVRLTAGATTIQTPINLDGTYSWPALPHGTYNLDVLSTKTYGGINATDALNILRHSVQLPPALVGIWEVGGDLNGDHTVKAVDALKVSQRFAGILPNFLPAVQDWISDKFTVVIDGTGNQVKDLLVLCAGDVNGSYNPIAKTSPNVVLDNDNSMIVTSQTMNIPVRVEEAMSVGAVSLALNVPSNLEILNVTATNTNENIVFKVKDGELRVAWYSTEPMNLKANDVLLTLKVKVTSLRDAIFTANADCEISDAEGMVIDNAGINIPKLVSSVNVEDYSLSNLPNPFSQSTDIHYSIPQSGFVTLKVFNVLGEEIITLVNSDQNAGKHVVNFEGSSLPRGVYVCKLQVGDVTKTRTMVISE